jgi:hypothetical protein
LDVNQITNEKNGEGTNVYPQSYHRIQIKRSEDNGLLDISTAIKTIKING